MKSISVFNEIKYKDQRLRQDYRCTALPLRMHASNVQGSDEAMLTLLGSD